MSDFCERQPEPPRLHYERQQCQHVSGVPTVARGCPAGWRKDAACLVEPKRLAAQPAARRHLTDEQPLLHETKIGPAPRGKVKWHSACGAGAAKSGQAMPAPASAEAGTPSAAARPTRCGVTRPSAVRA